MQNEANNNSHFFWQLGLIRSTHSRHEVGQIVNTLSGRYFLVDRPTTVYTPPESRSLSRYRSKNFMTFSCSAIDPFLAFFPPPCSTHSVNLAFNNDVYDVEGKFALPTFRVLDQASGRRITHVFNVEELPDDAWNWENTKVLSNLCSVKVVKSFARGLVSSTYHHNTVSPRVAQ